MRVFLLAAVLFLIIMPYAFADIANLTPNQTGISRSTGGNLPVYTGCTASTSYDCVDDPVLSPDETTTMIGCVVNGGEVFMFGLTDGNIPAGSTINWVRATIRADDTASGANAVWAVLNVSDTYYNGGSVNPPASGFADINGTNHTTNPLTVAAWTIDDITALGAGFNTNDCNPDLEVTQVYVQVDYTEPTTPDLRANASFGAGNVTFKLTGESFVFNGTCTSSGAASNDVVLKVYDNRTGSLAASTTDSTAIVYVNTTSYTNTTVGNNEVFGGSFNVTTNSTALNLTLVAECTSSNANGYNATNSIANIYRSYGFLDVTNINPLANTSQNVNQNGTFNMNATVACLSNVSNPVAYCGFVNATAVFNGTNLAIPDSKILASGAGGGITNASTSNTTVNPVACGSLMVQGPGSTGACSVNWTLNASGGIGSGWYIAVNFTSNGTNVPGNRTNSTQINITGGGAAIDVSFLLFVISNNATGTQSYPSTNATQQIMFNYTALNLVKGNASIGNGSVQNKDMSMFRYRNTGNTAINITMNLTTNLTGRPQSSSISIKAGWAENAWQDSCAAVNLSYPNTTCANITVNFTGNWPPVRVANLSTTGTAGGKDRDVWLWADWNNMVAMFDQAADLKHMSQQG